MRKVVTKGMVTAGQGVCRYQGGLENRTCNANFISWKSVYASWHIGQCKLYRDEENIRINYIRYKVL